MLFDVIIDMIEVINVFDIIIISTSVSIIAITNIILLFYAESCVSPQRERDNIYTYI